MPAWRQLMKRQWSIFAGGVCPISIFWKLGRMGKNIFTGQSIYFASKPAKTCKNRSFLGVFLRNRAFFSQIARGFISLKTVFVTKDL
jgi:hypothetical protein